MNKPASQSRACSVTKAEEFSNQRLRFVSVVAGGIIIVGFIFNLIM